MLSNELHLLTQIPFVSLIPLIFSFGGLIEFIKFFSIIKLKLLGLIVELIKGAKWFGKASATSFKTFGKPLNKTSEELKSIVEDKEFKIEMLYISLKFLTFVFNKNDKPREISGNLKKQFTKILPINAFKDKLMFFEFNFKIENSKVCNNSWLNFEEISFRDLIDLRSYIWIIVCVIFFDEEPKTIWN